MDREIGSHTRGEIAEPEARTPTARLPMMNAQNAPRTPVKRHFDVFADLYPNHCTPNVSPDVDRLVTAVERLSCCTVCAQRLITWLIEGRFGPDYQIALERIVLALALEANHESQ